MTLSLRTEKSITGKYYSCITSIRELYGSFVRTGWNLSTRNVIGWNRFTNNMIVFWRPVESIYE